jgi:hypothetical protein
MRFLSDNSFVYQSIKPEGYPMRRLPISPFRGDCLLQLAGERKGLMVDHHPFLPRAGHWGGVHSLSSSRVSGNDNSLDRRDETQDSASTGNPSVADCARLLSHPIPDL